MLKNWSVAVTPVMLNWVPAVRAVGDPVFPVPATNDWPGIVTTSLFIVPATSVSVPKFVTPAVTPLMVEVPLFVMLPEARGVPAEVRTRIFCHVNEFLTLLLLNTYGFPARRDTAAASGKPIVSAVVILSLRALPPL